MNPIDHQDHHDDADAAITVVATATQNAPLRQVDINGVSSK